MNLQELACMRHLIVVFDLHFRDASTAGHFLFKVCREEIFISQGYHEVCMTNSTAPFSHRAF